MRSAAYLFILSAPLSLNIIDHYLSLDDPTPYPEIRNITTSPSPASAVHFTPIYQRASQSPKTGAWSCAWHEFVAPDTVYNRTTGGSATDVFLGTLNWDPSPLLMTSYGALKRDFKEAWTSVAYGWVVISNGAGDTRVIGTLVRSTFLAHRGDDGRVLVGHTDMAKVDEGESRILLGSPRTRKEEQQQTLVRGEARLRMFAC